MQFTRNLLGVGFLFIASIAWAHGEHEPAGLTGIAPLWVWLAGGALALAFIMYYFYFARIDRRAEPALQPARAH